MEEGQLQQLYNAYLKSGLLSEKTSFDIFSQADETVLKNLYDLGMENKLLSEKTDFETFTSAWGLKKKDESQNTSQEEVTESYTPQPQAENGSLDVSVQEPDLGIPGEEVEETTVSETEDVLDTRAQGERVEETVEVDRTGGSLQTEDNTILEDIVGKNYLTDFIGDMYRAGKQGLVQGNTADEGWELMYKGADSNPEDILEFLQAQEDIAALGETDEMREFNQVYEDAGGGALGFLKGLAYAGPLNVISQLGAQTMMQMLNTSSLAAAGTAVGVGAGIGATAGAGILSAPGALAGATAALPAAYAASGAALETGLSFAEFLREAVEENGDSFDQAGIAKVLDDDDKMFKIRARSAGRGAVIGIIDRYSLKMGGKIISKQLVKGVSKGKRALTAIGVESVGGGVGEVGARLAVGQDMDAREIGFETIGGTGKAGFSYAYGSLLSKPKYKINSETKEGEVDLQTITDMILKSDDKDFAAMDFTIENDPELKSLADKRKNKLKVQNNILREVGEKNIPNRETLNELVALEVEKDALGSPSTEAGKKRLREIQEKIIGIYEGTVKVTQTTDDQGNTTTESIVITDEYAIEKLNEDGIDNPTEEQIAIKQAELVTEGEAAISKMKEDELLTKENTDAIQESITEEVDVQEQAEDGSQVGEGNQEQEIAIENIEGETNLEEATQEEIDAESKDLETLIDGESEVVENTEIVEEESRPLKDDITNRVEEISNKGEGFAKKWFNPEVVDLAGIKTDDELREYYIQSLENKENINDLNKDFLNKEFQRLGIDPAIIEDTEVDITPDSETEVNATVIVEEDGTLSIPNPQTGKTAKLKGHKVENTSNLFVSDMISENLEPAYEGDTEAQVKQETYIKKIAEKAAKAIAKLLPNTNIVLHRTEASYNRGAGQKSQIHTRKTGSRGVYKPATNDIHINMTHANAKTIAHEVFHALLYNKFKTDEKIGQITYRMVESVKKKITDVKLKAKLKKFTDMYDNTPQFKDEEYLAELIGTLADNYKSLKRPEKTVIQKWVNKVAKLVGMPMSVEIDTDADTLDLLATIAESVRDGKEITESDVKTLDKVDEKNESEKLRDDIKAVDKLNTEDKLKEEDDMHKALDEQRKAAEKSNNLPSGINAWLAENLGKIHVKDFIKYGDRNYISSDKRRGLNKLLRDTGPQDIDVINDVFNDDGLAYLDPQVIIDYLIDRTDNPGKYSAQNIDKARREGRTRDQKVDTTPNKLANFYKMNKKGFIKPEDVYDSNSLKEWATRVGLTVDASRGDKGEITSYYLRDSNNKIFTPSQDRMQVVFNSSDSNNSVVSKAREMDFSDASIKDYLKRIRKIPAAAIDALLKTKSEREISIPVVFGNVEGGMKQGERMFNDVNNELTQFITKNNPNNSEIREKGISLLENNDEFKSQSTSVQNDLISGFDRSLQTTANTTVQKKIISIRKDIRTMKVGADTLAKSKARLKQFIRTQLPVSKQYSKTDILRLTNLIANASEKTFLSDAEKVLKVVEKQRGILKKSLFKKMIALVDSKSKKKVLGSKKVRGKGLDAAGQQFFHSIKTILNAALKNEVDVLATMSQKLRADDVEVGGTLINVNETLTKELNGEKLTVKEQQLLEQIYALDTFGNVSNMSVEDIQSLYEGFKDVRAESIKRLAVKRLARTEAQNKLNNESSSQIKENYSFLYNPDGTLKDKNDLDRDASSTWDDFQKLKIWKGLSTFIERYPLTTGIGVMDFMRKKIQHLGTITNLMDNVAKGNNFFKDNVYNKLNQMHTKALEGERSILKSNDKGLGKIANTIEGITKGYKEWKNKLPKGQRVIYGKFKGGAKERSHSIDEMMRIYALSKNDVQRAKLEKMGYNADVLSQIQREITPLATEFVDKTVDYLSNEYFEETNSTYRQVNDVNLGFVDSYFPTQSISPSVDGLITEGDFNGVFNAEYDSAFKQRIDRESDVKIENLSFTNVLESHIKSMERYKSYAEGTKVLNNIFKSPDVNTLIQELGVKTIVKTMVNMAVNPNSGLSLSQTKLDRIQSKFTSFALSFKFMQIPKQATSFINAFEDYNYRGDGKTRIPGMDTLGFMMDMAKVIATLPKQVKKARKMSADFSSRLDQGLEGDVYGLESGSRVFKPIKGRSKMAKIIQVLKTGAASPTVIGDVMGVMGYMANYNRNIANGMSKADALLAFNNYNATQQSRRSTDKNLLQLQGDGLTRAFTMFGSTLFLQMNKVMSSTTNIMRTLKEKKIPTAKDTRALTLNFAIANMLFIATANMFKLSEGGEDEEEAMERIKDAAMGLNLLYQIPLIGGGAESIVSAIKGKRSYSNDVVNPYTSVFKKINRGFKSESTFDAVRPLMEIALGAQLDPFIGLFNTMGAEIDDASDIENTFRMLGVSSSYQPGSAKRSSSKSSSGKEARQTEKRQGQR